MDGYVLVVDDDEIIREMIRNSLADLGYSVSVAEGVDKAYGLLGENEFDVVITDKNMPGIKGGDEGGIDVLKEVRTKYPFTEVIMITGYATIESTISAMKHGAFDYLLKPFSIEELKRKVSKIIEYKSFLAETSIPLYKDIQSRIISILEKNPNLSEDNKKDLLGKMFDINDYFFKSLKTRDHVIIEQREALANIAAISEQLSEQSTGNPEIDELLQRIIDESNRRI